MQTPGSLAEQVAQLICVRLGSNLPPVSTVSQDADRVAQLVDRYQIGGLVLFQAGRADDAAKTLAWLQRRSEIPLLVAMDMENGSGQQVVDHVSWPHALAFHALGADAEDAVEQFAFASSREASSIGVHISFSPVLDIHRNPQNPIISTRAFGTSANRVIELASAYVRGCHAGGLLCCGKHFPGHGNTTTDSHRVLPIVQDSAAVLRQLDLLPFEVLVKQNIDMLMTAHVAYPALDPTGAPATLSRPMLHNLLRDTWGYSGIVVSDSFKMEGIRQTAAAFDPSGGATHESSDETSLSVQAVKAGVDLLLDITDVDAVVRELTRKAETDDDLRARIEASCQRLWHVKRQRFDIHGQTSTPPTWANRNTARAHAEDVASRAIQSFDGTPWTPRWAQGTPVRVILAHPAGDRGYTRTDTLVSLCRQKTFVTSLTVLGPEPNSLTPEMLLADDGTSGDGNLVVLLTAPDDWPEYGIPAWQAQLIQQLTARVPTAVVSLGTEDVLKHFPQAALRLATFSDSAVSQAALVKRLLLR